MVEVSIIAIDLAKRVFQVHGTAADGWCFPPKAVSAEAAGVSVATAAMPGSDGGVRDGALLGTRDHEVRPRGQAYPTDLREALC